MKILICDDAGFVREILHQALTDMGHDVVGEARDGAEVIEKAQALRPDVIILDLVLPVRNGAEAARELRALGVDAKTILLSTVDRDFLEKMAQDLGCDAFLVKPFTKADLREVFEGLENGLREVQNG